MEPSTAAPSEKKPFERPTVTKIGKITELAQKGMGTDGQGNPIPTG